jgi:hypothetical protein
MFVWFEALKECENEIMVWYFCLIIINIVFNLSSVCSMVRCTDAIVYSGCTARV